MDEEAKDEEGTERSELTEPRFSPVLGPMIVFPIMLSWVAGAAGFTALAGGLVAMSLAAQVLMIIEFVKIKRGKR